jgi:hypothetical protein
MLQMSQEGEGHYARQCPKKEKGKGKQQQMQFAGSAETTIGIDELASTLKTSSIVSCMSTNTTSSFGWYVDSGAFKT